LKCDPEHEEVLRLLTDLLLNQQKGIEAIPFYERLLQLTPNDKVALNNADLCYSSIGVMNKGIEKLQTCIELYPDDPVGYVNLALQYKDTGDYENSRRIYESGVS